MRFLCTLAVPFSVIHTCRYLGAHLPFWMDAIIIACIIAPVTAYVLLWIYTGHMPRPQPRRSKSRRLRMAESFLAHREAQQTQRHMDMAAPGKQDYTVSQAWKLDHDGQLHYLGSSPIQPARRQSLTDTTPEPVTRAEALIITIACLIILFILGAGTYLLFSSL